MQKRARKSNCKDVPCEGVEMNMIVAVYQDEAEMCTPHFHDLERAMQPVSNSKLISIPIKDENLSLVFVM